MVLFEDPGQDVIRESITRNEIVNKIDEVGGLGWELVWSHPMVVWRESDDEEFEIALNELREKVHGLAAVLIV
jgi:hypothetical protein